MYSRFNFWRNFSAGKEADDQKEQAAAIERRDG